MWLWFYRLASPKWFYGFADKLIPWLLGWSIVLLFIGSVWGLVYSPVDYQQGDSVRIMYLHVPAAFLSMAVYVIMAWAAFVGLVWRIKLSFMWAKSSVMVGAGFTFLALATGSLWGKPMWGTWWIWDARLTSELILLFLYLGLLALHQAIDKQTTADKACALLAIVGVVNIPIIHYSVDIWRTLHQPASLSKFGKPSIDASMLWPLLIMILAFFLVYLTLVFMQTRNEILAREANAQWLKDSLQLRN